MLMHMPMQPHALKGRSFLKLLDYTPAEIEGLIDLALELKAQKKAGIPHRLCEGKSIALEFSVRLAAFSKSH